jgi:hypothetical protein
MNPNCVFGVCSKCNPNILILADSQTGVNQAMATAFKAQGFIPTVVDNGAQQYAGMMPKATDFAAILLIPGNNFTTDMPMPGQQAIASAQAAGVGIVLDGFTPFNITNGRSQGLKNLALLSGGNGNTFNQGTVQYVNPNLFQPWFSGTTGSFTEVNQEIWFTTSVSNNGTQVGVQTALNVPAEVFRASPNGRIVQLGYGINYQNGASQWTNDANMTQWTISAVRYAAGCTM